MANLMPLPKMRFTDSNGRPLVGGKVYFYVAGTSTPKNTYKDRLQVTTNLNPVILDSNGEADIWLEMGYYKVVLKDSSDVTRWTSDQISTDTGGLNVDDINAAVSQSQAAAGSAEASAIAAEASASRVDLGALDQAVSDAQDAADIAEGAVSGSVNTFFAATKSAADTLAASLGDGATVIVDRDETRVGVRVRYTVAAGVLISPVTDTAIVQVATIADLRNLEPAFDGQQCELLGHTVAGIGGGMFYADYSSGAVDDNGVTVVTSGGKRWVRRLIGYVMPEFFGAIGDGTANDNAALQAAVDSGVSNIWSGQYLTQGSIFLNDESHIVSLNAVLLCDASTMSAAAGIVSIEKNNWQIEGKLTLRMSDFSGSAPAVRSEYNNGLFISDSRYFRVSDLTVEGFADSGIKIQTNNDKLATGDICRSAFANCVTRRNYQGLSILPGFSSEYITLNNFNSNWNTTSGIYIAAGNIAFSGGMSTHNDVGFHVIDGGFNPAHGNVVGMLINHNNSRAVIASNVTVGHVFSGCNIFDNAVGGLAGCIELTGSGGVIFSGCQIMAGVKSEGSTLGNMFVGCTWAVAAGRNYTMDFDDAKNAPLFFNCTRGGSLKINGSMVMADGLCGASVVKTTTQTILSGTNESVTWDVVDAVYGGANIDGNGAFVCPVDGIYEVTVDLKIAGTAQPAYVFVICSNGSQSTMPLAVGYLENSAVGSCFIKANNGNTISVVVHSGTGDKNIVTGTKLTVRYSN